MRHRTTCQRTLPGQAGLTPLAVRVFGPGGKLSIALARAVTFAGLAGCLALAAVIPASATQIDRGVIRGGIGVAGVELGMARTEVIRLHGPPVTQNAGPDGAILYMAYSATDEFGIYFGDDDTVRMLIVTVSNGKMCTAYGACIGRRGDLDKIRRHYGKRLIRFTDRDGSVTYRRLAPLSPRNVMIEFTPDEKRNAFVQVTMLYWDGKIDDSSLD